MRMMMKKNMMMLKILPEKFLLCFLGWCFFTPKPMGLICWSFSRTGKIFVIQADHIGSSTHQLNYISFYRRMSVSKNRGTPKRMVYNGTPY